MQKEQFLIYIITRTSYILIRWWWWFMLYNRSARLVGFL